MLAAQVYARAHSECPPTGCDLTRRWPTDWPRLCFSCHTHDTAGIHISYIDVPTARTGLCPHKKSPQFCSFMSNLPRIRSTGLKATWLKSKRSPPVWTGLCVSSNITTGSITDMLMFPLLELVYVHSKSPSCPAHLVATRYFPVFTDSTNAPYQLASPGRSLYMGTIGG